MEVGIGHHGETGRRGGAAEAGRRDGRADGRAVLRPSSALGPASGGPGVRARRDARDGAVHPLRHCRASSSRRPASTSTGRSSVNYFTSLEMMGVTLTVMRLGDDELRRWIDAPARCVAFRGLADERRSRPGRDRRLVVDRPGRRDRRAARPGSASSTGPAATATTGSTCGPGWSWPGRGSRRAPRLRRDAARSATTLLEDIGGAMGPLYGVFFIALADAAKDREWLDASCVRQMFAGGCDEVIALGGAEVGDKTLVDVLVPTVAGLDAAIAAGKDLSTALLDAARIAAESRDATEGMVAKLGRAARAGERSRGQIDAGAASCALIVGAICTVFADNVQTRGRDLVNEGSTGMIEAVNGGRRPGAPMVQLCVDVRTLRGGDRGGGDGPAGGGGLARARHAADLLGRHQRPRRVRPHLPRHGQVPRRQGDGRLGSLRQRGRRARHRDGLPLRERLRRDLPRRPRGREGDRGQGRRRPLRGRRSGPSRRRADRPRSRRDLPPLRLRPAERVGGRQQDPPAPDRTAAG